MLNNSRELRVESRKSKISGFTLIEIMVAVFILVLTMSILHGTFIFTSHAHKSVESISDNLSSLNGALELIKKDLRYLHP
ncbi:MAG: prepilin-type N-terminal cleavage/methylation domain-containing protein, partial [Nitrospirota bacterium]